MPASSLVAYAHFVAAFALVAAVAYEAFTFRRDLTLRDAKRIAVADRVYGVSALVLLIAGFSRAIWFEKGWSFYASSPFFHAKIGLFVLIGLLSVYPTDRFARWGRDLKAGRTPAVSAAEARTVKRLLHAQLALVVLLVLCASLMAKGVRF